MPVSDLHRQLAAIALGAAGRYGFALAGGNALIAHGVVNRFTADVDLFTDEEAGVAAAAEAVEAALTAAGFQAERRDKTGGLADIFPDIGEGLAEWIVTAPTGEQTMLQMAYFERDHRPVAMDIGPVLEPGGRARSARSARWPAGSSPAITWTPQPRWSATVRQS